MTDHCQALERLLHHDIPLTRAMQLQVLSWQAHELRLRLPLQANSNHHHSMFGGSLYSALRSCRSCLLKRRKKIA